MAVKTLALSTTAECTSVLLYVCANVSRKFSVCKLRQTSAIKINVEHSSKAVVFNYQST
jgi:hypothetical protein